VHHEFLCQGQTVNRCYYLEVLKRLSGNVRRRRPHLWRNNSWFLHHDNAPAHASPLNCHFLANTNITVLPQPPYSPDLAPADIFLLPKLKSTLKGWRFQTIQEITENSQAELRTIPKKVCHDSFQKWQRRWERCSNEGDEAHSVAGMSEKIIKKIVPKLLEQTT
jgi:transposase